nr:hypothetical protein [Anaerolineae bacterium]
AHLGGDGAGLRRGGRRPAAHLGGDGAGLRRGGRRPAAHLGGDGAGLRRGGRRPTAHLEGHRAADRPDVHNDQRCWYAEGSEQGDMVLHPGGVYLRDTAHPRPRRR